MSKYISTQYPGVRYREHSERKYNGKPDRYFFIRYKRQGKTIEEAFGWASTGANAQKANKVRSELIENIRLGKRPQTLNEKREMEAARYEAERQAAIVDEKKNFTFKELAEHYIEWAKSNKKSWKDDKHRYNNHLKQLLGELPLKDISPLHLERLKRNLQKKKAVKVKRGGKANKLVPQDNFLSPATIKQCLALVRQMFNKANDWDLFNGSNPVKKISLPTLNNKRTRFLTYKEAKQLLEELTKRSMQVHDEALLSLQCGLRFGEIAALTLGDLDFNNDIIQVRDAKGGESRQSYMTPEVKALLRIRARNFIKSNDLIFPDNKNGKLQKTVSRTYKEVVKDLEFNKDILDRRNKVVFHTLRHTFASWLAINGTPLYTIKELMGHKTLSMTERYAHLIPDHKKQAVKDMAEAFRKGLKTEKDQLNKGDVKHA